MKWSVLLVLMALLVCGGCSVRVDTDDEDETARRHQVAAPEMVDDVMASLEGDLAEIAGQYPELAGWEPKAEHVADRQGDSGLGIFFERNCTWRGEAGWQDSTPDAAAFQFVVRPMPGPEAFYGRGETPQLELPNLRVHGWSQIHVGPGASEGLRQDLRECCRKHVEMLAAMDSRILESRGRQAAR